jgi:hypothetical protein
LIIEPEINYYAVATALHPALRLAWFHTHWKPYCEWVKKASDSLNRVFKQYVAAEADDDEESPKPTRRKLPSNHSKLYSQTMAVDFMYLTGSRNYKRAKRTSQLKGYFDDLREDLLNANESSLALLNDLWGWCLNVGRNKYPIVFKIATDYLVIPATSCECERCFSTAKRTITCDRNRLDGASIEALQLQKNWLRRGVVESYLLHLQAYVERLDRGAVDDNNSEHSLLGAGATPS